VFFIIFDFLLKILQIGVSKMEITLVCFAGNDFFRFSLIEANQNFDFHDF